MPSLPAQDSPLPPTGQTAPVGGPELEARVDVLLKAARALGLPLAGGPTALDPALDRPLFDCFLELALPAAETGSPRAAAWCLRNRPEHLQETAEGRALLVDLYERALPLLPSESLSRDLDPLGEIGRDARVLGDDLLRRLELVGEREDAPALRRAAALARALALAPREPADIGRRDQARALGLQAREGAADGALGRRAEDLLWRLDHLVPGALPPDLLARDADGNEVRLSDLRGRAVMVELWSLEDPTFLARVQRRAGLVERFRERPFALVGINLDADEQVFRVQSEELGIRWTNAFGCKPDGTPLNSWKSRESGMVLLFDGAGRLRCVDPLERTLDERALELVEEAEAPSARR